MSHDATYLMDDDKRLTRDEIESIARELIAVGRRNAESVPICEWRKMGHPESARLFRTIDACIKYLRSLDIYST